MSFVNSVSYPTSIRSDSEGFLSLGRGREPIENLEHDFLRREEARPIITLHSSLSDEQKEEALRRLGFSAEARERIYHHFINGRDGILEGLSNGTITLERISFSKPSNGTPQPKFYLVVHDKKGEGGINKFFHGYSRRGTPRGIRTYGRETRVDFSAAEDLSRRSNAYHESICRLKGHEEGINALELGGESLYTLDMTTFSKRERWSLYMHLIWLLMNLHASGYVHGDIKQENIVVIRDGGGSIVGFRFIDLDTLAKGQIEDTGGTMALFSPDRMAELLSYSETLYLSADPKDDVWGMMGLICELECKAIKNAPDQNDLALIDPRILRCWDQYARTMFDEFSRLRNMLVPFALFANDYFRQHPPTDESALFGGLAGDYLLDPVIMAMSRFKKDDRISAEELFQTYFQTVPEAFEEEDIVPASSSTIKLSPWERIWKGFLRCLSYLFCYCFRESQ